MPANEICKLINSSNSDFFSFLYGFKVIIRKCKEIQNLNKDEFTEKKYGSILQINDDSTFDVKTGNGIVRIEDYLIQTTYTGFNDIQIFLEKANIARPPILTSVPFTNNEEANEWEKMYLRFTVDHKDLAIKDETISSSKLFRSKKEAKPICNVEPDSPEGRRISENQDFIKYLINEVGLKKNSKVLDIGCGTGWASYIFATHGMDAFGADVNQYMIDVARKDFPSCTFFILDIFDLPKKDDLKGKFDFIFCRGLGVAQKIVDWNSQDWQNVGKSVIDLLSDYGIIYWIQMTDGSGLIKDDGFSHPTVKTVVKYFEKFSYILDISVYGYVSLLLTKKNSNSTLLDNFQEFIHRRNTNIYSKWLETKNQDNSIDLAKVLYSQLSNVLLSQSKSQKNGVIITGTDNLAIAYAKVAKDLGLVTKAFVWDKESKGLFHNIQVIPIEEAVKLDPHAVIFTSKKHRELIDKNNLTSDTYHIIESFETQDSFSDIPKIFLLSGDQDAHIDKEKLSPILEILTGKDSDILHEYTIIHNALFDNWSEVEFPLNWSLVGNDTSVKKGSDNNQNILYLENHKLETAALFQRLSDIEKIHDCSFGLGCWILSDQPNSARIQVSTDKGDVASEFHSGSGKWEFCAVTRHIETAKYIDVYLQILGSGKATFRGLTSYLSEQK